MINEKIEKNLKPLVWGICKDRGINKLEVAIIFYSDSLSIEIECYNPEPFIPYGTIKIRLDVHHELPAKMVSITNSRISQELYKQLIEQKLDSCIEFRDEYKSMHKMNATKQTIKILYEYEDES